MTPITKYLVPTLKSILSGSTSHYHINLLIKISVQFASVRLAQLIKKNKIHFDIYPHSINTTALDCIAELFQRDENGSFFELVNYFTGQNSPDNLSDEEVVISFRRLIFSKLNDGIFRLYRENDPILSKIIRNVKLAVKVVNSIKQFERFGENYIGLNAKNDECDHLDEYPFDKLVGDLIPALNGKENTKEQILKLFEVIKENNSYRNYLPLVKAAKVIREISFKYYSDEAGTFSNTTKSFEFDVHNIYNDTMKQFNDFLNEKYVLKSKLDRETCGIYIRSIERILYNEYVTNNGLGCSYYDYIKEVTKSISYNDYRKNHRMRFEYLVKIAKKMLLENLRDEI